MKRKYLWKTINIIDVGPVHSLGLQLILISFNLINHLVYEMSKKKKSFKIPISTSQILR